MNSWKLNSKSSYYIRKVISDKFNINISEVYKQIKDIDKNNIFTSKDNKRYKLILAEII